MSEPPTTIATDNFSRATLIYAIALGLIASLAVVTHLAMDAIVMHEEETARVVNISGRQRMLSQRLAMLALERGKTADLATRQALSDEMLKSITLMESSHDVLRNGSKDLDISPGRGRGIAAIYDQPPYFLDRQVTAYIDQARRLSALSVGDPAEDRLLSDLLAAAHGPILLGLDAAVKQYESDSEASLKGLRHTLIGLLAAMLLTLAAEAIFIFRPLFRKLEAAHLRLLDAARTDPLTGCMNRRYLMDAAAREVAREKRDGQSMSVMVLDVDHFKMINDTYGHALGDEALLVLVHTLIANIRASDLLGRIGGEEFAILLPETSIEQAMPVAEKLRACVASTPVSNGNVSFNMTASIGLASLDPAQSDFLSALERADKALYAAKKSGRNRVVAFTPELQDGEASGF